MHLCPQHDGGRNETDSLHNQNQRVEKSSIPCFIRETQSKDWLGSYSDDFIGGKRTTRYAFGNSHCDGSYSERLCVWNGQWNYIIGTWSAVLSQGNRFTAFNTALDFQVGWTSKLLRCFGSGNLWTCV